jgi:uncharacterized protein
VYACDFFVEPEWKLGNLLEVSLEAMMNSPRQNEFGLQKVRLPQDCLDCQWKVHCRGGCTKDRLRNPLGSGRNHFCEAYKIFYPYADTRLRGLVETWKRKNNQ